MKEDSIDNTESTRSERPPQLPACEKRRLVNGIYMCYAIGLFELGDMPCECSSCGRAHGIRPSFCCHKLK